MSRINILDSSVFNRIAAGEVVDKPASVVKELVENAIDSGATAIDVTVENGGRYIKVTDNGCGMDYDDLSVALMPHATSKIKDLGDLDAILTLGFRGEALPSIASVARVTITSRRREDETGGRIITENGKVIEKTQTGAPAGTTVLVEDLFANVPARLKFLRSARSEEGEISSLMQRVMIANYNIAISLTISGKEIFRTEGKGLEEAVYSVYGPSFLKEYDYICGEMPGIELYGYINKPAFSKHNRSYQTLIVNGRYVVNQDISFWIYNCCAHLLMKRQYPAYVIFLNVPADMVDINVHPSKMEVKFVDLGRIKRLISSVLNESLARAAAQPKTIETPNDASAPDRSAAETTVDIVFDPDVSKEKGAIAFRSETPLTAVGQNPAEEDKATDVAGIPHKPDRKRYGEYHSVGAVQGRTGLLQFSETPKKPQSEQYSLLKDILSERSDEDKDGYDDLSEHKYCGKLFNTYLLLENRDEVVLIDQHAAHEKLLYEELVQNLENGKNTVQDLLLPYIFDVDHRDAVLIDENIDEIRSIGFGLNRLSGNSYSLSSVPLILSDMDLTYFVTDLTEIIRRGNINKLPFVKSALMQSACKAAIKGETDITDDDAKLLVRRICEKRIELFCPHGRPIAVKLKKTEIEKWFKRIV